MDWVRWNLDAFEGQRRKKFVDRNLDFGGIEFSRSQTLTHMSLSCTVFGSELIKGTHDANDDVGLDNQSVWALVSSPFK
jgi:hypothetical protein